MNLHVEGKHPLLYLVLTAPFHSIYHAVSQLPAYSDSLTFSKMEDDHVCQRQKG